MLNVPKLKSRERRLLKRIAAAPDPLSASRLRFALALRRAYWKIKKKSGATPERLATMRAAKRRKQKRRHDLILSIKDRPCTDCRRTFDPSAMEFDHVPERGPKVNNISSMLKGALSLLLAEIAKCDVVCCECHERRENARGRSHSIGKLCPNARKATAPHPSQATHPS